MNAKAKAFFLLISIPLLCLTQTTAHAEDTASGKLYHRINLNEKQINVVIQLTMQPDWHLYHTELGAADAVGMPLTITPNANDIVWSKSVLPAPKNCLNSG